MPSTMPTIVISMEVLAPDPHKHGAISLHSPRRVLLLFPVPPAVSEPELKYNALAKQKHPTGALTVYTAIAPFVPHISPGPSRT